MGRKRRDGAFYEGFGRRVEDLMNKRRLRPGQLAERMKVSPGTVTRWKSGSMPDPDTLPKLAQILGTTAAALQGLATSPAPVTLEPDPAVAEGLQHLAEILDEAAAEARRIASLLPDER